MFFFFSLLLLSSSIVSGSTSTNISFSVNSSIAMRSERWNALDAKQE